MKIRFYVNDQDVSEWISDEDPILITIRFLSFRRSL